MHTCSCTNQCPACGQCCAVGCEHRRSAGPWTSPSVPYKPSAPIERAKQPRLPVDIRIVQPKPPLTEDDLRRLIREGIAEALDELRALPSPRQELTNEEDR